MEEIRHLHEEGLGSILGEARMVRKDSHHRSDFSQKALRSVILPMARSHPFGIRIRSYFCCGHD